MSNYLSAPLEVSPVKSSLNLPLIDKVLSMKQGAYDTNKAKLDQSLALYGEKLQGLRAEDNEYIASRINDVSSFINNNNELDLSLSSNASALTQQVNSLVKDPIIMDAVLNKAKVDNFNSEIKKLKEKRPEKFNEDNYNDALERAGVNSYMRGESKSVNSPQYHDYVNVVGDLNKIAADYVKQRGLKEQYLGTENGTYETVDKYGVVVTKSDIQDYLMSSIDGNTKTQMQINARAEMKGMSEAQFKTIRTSQLKGETYELENTLAATLAQMKSLPKDQQELYKEKIEQYNNIITSNKTKIESGVFDEGDIYKNYIDSTVIGIASSHDIAITTKLDRSNLPFEVIKFEVQTSQKERELVLREQANTIAKNANMGGGTITEKPVTTEDKKLTDFERIGVETSRTANALDAYLMQNDEKFKTMTPSQQWDYKLHLDADNPTVKGATPQLQNLISAFQDAQRTYATVVSEVKDKIEDTIQLNYNNLMQGKDLNLNGLAKTMPLTASLLGKNKSFSTLSKEEQQGIVAEIAANNLQYNSSIKGDERKAYEKVVASNKVSLNKNKSAKAKEVNKILSGSTETDEVGGYFSNAFGNVFYGTFLKGIKNTLIDPRYNNIKAVVTTPFIGADKAEENLQKDTLEDEKDFRDIGQNLHTARRFLRDMNPFEEDTNITELESRDTRGGVQTDVQESFTTLGSNIREIINNRSSALLPNLQDNKAYTFSTTEPSQSTIARALRAAVINSGEDKSIPAGTNDYTVSREGEGYRISYLNKKGDALDNTYVTKLPENIANTFDTSVQNWSNNPLNPNIVLKPKVIQPFTNPNDRDDRIENLLENVPLSREERIKLKTNPDDTAFATVDEYKKAIINNPSYGKEFYEKNKQEIDYILNITHTAKPKVEGGQFYMQLDYKDKNGKPSNFYGREPIGSEKNEHVFYLKYLQAVSSFREQQIQSLK